MQDQTSLFSEDEDPRFYQLEKDDTRLCLATDFTRHDKLKDNELFKEQNGTFIDRESTDPATKGLYSQVAFMSTGDEDKCEESSGFNDSLQPDSVVNTVSLTVIGLRILFVKTVAINVLVTLRLCISS
ncbi:hypothetical protein NQD34_013196 [Periophthalmus magnuspinnatus]|nr:hypothetical protein NQD34_013196 [Periophthalmus magnuspinnatus]